MRILAYTAYYPPEIASSLYLSEDIHEAMANAGHQVMLYAPSPTRGIDESVRRAYKKKKREALFGGAVRIRRVPLFRETDNPIARGLRYLALNLAFLFKGLFARADVIFVQSTPPTQGAMAALLGLLTRTPVVYNLQDIFPDSMVIAGMIREGSRPYRIGRKIEDFSYRNTQRLIVISEDFRDNVRSKGVADDKIVIAPNWPDTRNVFPVPRADNVLFDRYALDRSLFYVCYSGNIGLTQDMDLLLEAAKRILTAQSAVRFVLIGDGADRVRVEARVKDEGIGNVIVLPFEPYERIAHVFSLGDVGLIISKPGVGSSSVPSKTWSIMAAARPVLAAFDLNSELCRIIAESGGGSCVQAGDAEAFTREVLRLYEQRDTLATVGERGRAYVLGKRIRETSLTEYIRALEETARAGRRGKHHP